MTLIFPQMVIKNQYICTIDVCEYIHYIFVVSGGDELHDQERLPIQPRDANLPPLEDRQHEIW